MANGHEPTKKKRPCCTSGKRHMPFSKRRYSFQVSRLGASGGGRDGRVTGYLIVRVPTLSEDSGVDRTTLDAAEKLCVGGHWATPKSGFIEWKFQSARAADDMARRLSAGLPVHRDRWLGWGAFLLVAAELTQAVKWWPT